MTKKNDSDGQQKGNKKMVVHILVLDPKEGATLNEEMARELNEYNRAFAPMQNKILADIDD